MPLLPSARHDRLCPRGLTCFITAPFEVMVYVVYPYLDWMSIRHPATVGSVVGVKLFQHLFGVVVLSLFRLFV